MRHGAARRGAKTRTYITWEAMVARCTQPRRHDFSRYVGQGITVCDRWRSFAHFLADMGERPPGMTLDRIDNARGYGKDNCRWATTAEQARNTRRTVWLTHEGITLCLSDWAERMGICHAALQQRLHGGDRGARLFRPRRIQTITHEGVTRTVPAWAARVGLRPTTLYGRLSRGDTGARLFRAPLGKVG